MAEPLTPDELADIASYHPKCQWSGSTVARLLTTVDQVTAERDALQAMVDSCRELVRDWLEGEELETADELHKALQLIVGWPEETTTDG